MHQHTILALDLSTTKTGVALLQSGLVPLLSSISPAKTITTIAKLQYIRDQVAACIATHNPSVIIIEDIYKGPSVKVFKVLSMLQGVIACLAADHNIPVTYLNAASVRSRLGLPRDKVEAFAALVTMQELDPSVFKFKTHNDCVDALALGLAHNV